MRMTGDVIMVEVIEKQYKRLNRIKKLNRGGCGIASYAMLKWIEREHPEYFKETKIVFDYHNEDELWCENEDSITYYDIDEFCWLSPCAHIYLEVDGVLMDSHGVRSKPPSLAHLLEAQEHESKLLDCINNGYWCEKFDWEYGIKRIEDILNISLDEIENMRHRPNPEDVWVNG